MADLAALTRMTAETLRKDNPEIKVCGPCHAWPYPNGDWKAWEKQRRFIELAGDCVGAYDLHFYSKGHWSLPPEPEWQKRRVPEPSLYEAQRLGINTVWDYGRLDAYLDLFAAYHMQVWRASQPKPMIISEFGNQTVYPQMGPWNNDFKPWLYMTTVIRQWLTYMERPEVELTIPFILGESDLGVAARRGQAVYTRPGGNENPELKPTRFRDFFRFFKELDGRRIFSVVEDGRHGEALRVRSFLDGKVAYLLIHNSKGFPRHHAQFSIDATLGKDNEGKPVKVERAEIRRLYYEGNIPDPQRDETCTGILNIEQVSDYKPLDSLDKIELRGEETAIVRLTLSGVPQTTARLTEISSYASSTLQDVTPEKPQEFKIPIAKWPGRIVSAHLYLGIARDGGFTENPKVMVNGKEVEDLDITWSKGIKDFHAPVIGSIAPENIVQGENTVSVVFPASTPRDGWPKIVTAKIVATHENQLQ